jgi:hypothetical protein
MHACLHAMLRAAVNGMLCVCRTQSWCRDRQTGRLSCRCTPTLLGGCLSSEPADLQPLSYGILISAMRPRGTTLEHSIPRHTRPMRAHNELWRHLQHFPSVDWSKAKSRPLESTKAARKSVLDSASISALLPPCTKEAVSAVTSGACAQVQ